jgi:hypothetical protein
LAKKKKKEKTQGSLMKKVFIYTTLVAAIACTPMMALGQDSRASRYLDLMRSIFTSRPFQEYREIYLNTSHEKMIAHGLGECAKFDSDVKTAVADHIIAASSIKNQWEQRNYMSYWYSVQGSAVRSLCVRHMDELLRLRQKK